MSRLDVAIVERALLKTRSQAQDAIKEERVKVNDKVIKKPAFEVSETDVISIEEAELAFASRAGLKLFYALEEFKINLHDKVVLDVGASTGGFTDVCLRHGAKKVYAADVGSDQLIEELRNNPKVVNMENTNCRYLTPEMFDEKPDFVCMDVSFISILSIVPNLIPLLNENFEMVLLIKPQFEAGKKDIGKNGIVKDSKVHVRVLSEIVDALHALNLGVYHLTYSHLKGRDGNQEYVVHVTSKYNQPVFNYREIVNSSKHN